MIASIASITSDERGILMEISKRFLWITIALCCLSVFLLLHGYFFDTPFWGALTAKCVSAPLFFPIMAIGIILIAVVMLKRESEDTPDQAKTICPLLIGIIGAVAGMIVLWIVGNGGYFWRNIFSGPISIFGNYSDILGAYSELPPDPDLVQLWDQDGLARIITVVLGGVYLFLLSLIAAEISTNARTRIAAFLFMATSGLLAVFASPGDFAVLLVLSALNVLLTLRFFSGKLSIYIPGIVILISVVFHPVFVLFALAILFVRLSGSFLANEKPGIPLLLLLALIVLGSGLSLFQSIPFVSIMRPETSVSPVFGPTQVWGFANQMFMVSHFIWLIALVTAVYMFVTSRVKELYGILIGAWFVAASAFYISSYSVYGWIFGYPGAAVVVFAAILWLVYFISRLERPLVKKTFAVLVIVNVLATVSLLATVRSDTVAIDTFSSRVVDEIAFKPRFNDGYGTLLLGVMYGESIMRPSEAVEILEPFRRRYPLNLLGKYYYSCALANIPGQLIKGLDLMRELNQYLIDENALFWEFNYRIGILFIGGHNAYLASMSLERAAAEKNTAELAFLLGNCYEGIKAPDSVRSKYRQAIELGDSSRVNFFKVARASEQIGDSATAFEYHYYGVEHFPDYEENYQYLARYYFLNEKVRSPGLEASMLLAFNYTGRDEERDSAVVAFMDYYQTYPEGLYTWGKFLEENGMIYEGRKMQAADITVDWLNLKATLTFYHYYRGHDMPDSARALIDRYIEMDTTTIVLEVLDAVKRYDTVLWPPERAIDQ
jgi:tetratricopeptide (TPR) repeat protein